VTDRAGVGFLLAPRREILDDLLARAAVAAGARLLTGTAVTGVLRAGDGTVTGVSARDRDGTRHEITARLVVGADGVHSPVARHVGAEVVQQHEPGGATFYTYVDDVPWDGMELHLSDRFYAGVFPTHHGQACVWLMRPTAYLADVLRAGSRRADAWLDELDREAPDLARRVREGRVTAPLRGAVGLPNHVRRASGPGWALVGDAGYHRDPITGHGMTDAFRDAELLADAADSLLTGTEPEARAMGRYEARRDAALAPTFALTVALGRFPEPSEFTRLQARYSRLLEEEALSLAEQPSPAYRRSSEPGRRAA
jgi:flavin-dependent dehydrogenase